MVSVPCTPAILRFPRRNPLSLLVLIIPLSLLLYVYFDPLTERRSDLQPIDVVIDNNSSSPTTDNTGPRILLVSALFFNSSSKHVLREQTDALVPFLSSITTDVYLFTTPDLEPLVRDIRGALPITINTSYTTPFNIPPLKDFEDAYAALPAVASSRSAHILAEFAARAAAPFFLSAATAAATEPYDYAFWADPDAFRLSPAYAAWPDPARVAQVWASGRRESGARERDLLLLPMHALPHVSMLLWKEHMGPIENDFTDMSFFGGPTPVVEWWATYFYAYHAQYIAQQVYKGHADALANALVLMHPERVITVWPRDPSASPEDNAAGGVNSAHKTQGTSAGGATSEDGALGDCGTSDADARTYYQFWLASPRERAGARAAWAARWRWDWRPWMWWRTRAPCRAAHVLAMEWQLHRLFGAAWFPPATSVKFEVGR